MELSIHLRNSYINNYWRLLTPGGLQQPLGTS